MSSHSDRRNASRRLRGSRGRHQPGRPAASVLCRGDIFVTGLPIRQDRESATLELIGEHDVPWISALIHEVDAALGRPWRELLDRIARLPVRATAARRAALVDVVRRMLSGRERGPIKAAEVRQRLLGPIRARSRCPRGSACCRRGQVRHHRRAGRARDVGRPACRTRGCHAERSCWRRGSLAR